MLPPAPDPVPAAVGDQHPRDERCFFCASDAELTAALAGRPHLTIHMGAPVKACPDAVANGFLSIPDTSQEGTDAG